jgi:hypothetical protein
MTRIYLFGNGPVTFCIEVQLVALLEQVRGLSDHAGGPSRLNEMLLVISALCTAAGGCEPLVAMLSSSADLVSACGGAGKARVLMQELSDLIRSVGNIEAFTGMMEQMKILTNGVGGANKLAQLLSDMMKLIRGVGGIGKLLQSLLDVRESHGALSSGSNITPEQTAVCSLIVDMCLDSQVGRMPCTTTCQHRRGIDRCQRCAISLGQTSM